MSLFRQLWLTIILVTLISFSGSFAVSLLSTRSYLEQQLHRKNVDSANSLAHSISRLSKDPATVGLQIDAFFNSGQYETISITAPDGTVITERVAGPVETHVPGMVRRSPPHQRTRGTGANPRQLDAFWRDQGREQHRPCTSGAMGTDGNPAALVSGGRHLVRIHRHTDTATHQ